MSQSYCKRLIEVDLPIARISAHARREKSIRHGHISTLHIWWARRPLAACRAVICAALWPDPADPLCPQAFRDEAAQLMNAFARQADGDMKLLATSSEESKKRWAKLTKTPLDSGDAAALPVLRAALLDFIADFANWDNSTVREYLETSRALTQAAHEALGGAPGTRPLVVDPFAGGGSIPLEALRVGADAFASDLNPVAVLLNKVVLEYIPKYGQRLADEVRKWGQWIKEQAEKELAEFYPKDPDGATPIAYLWARTIQCEGPGCGAEVPLIRSLWLAKKANRSVALQLLPQPTAKRVDFRIIVKQGGKWVDQGDPKSEISDPQFDGTVKRGSATCPCCGYTTPVQRVREQLKERRGGAADSRLFCVVTNRVGEQGRTYRLPLAQDREVVNAAVLELARRQKNHSGSLSLVPNEEICLNEIRRISLPIYGMSTWGDLFSPRQLLTLVTLAGKLRDVAEQETGCSLGLLTAVQTTLALGIGRLLDRSSSLCRWDPTPAASGVINTFSRQAIPMMWDFAEGAPLEQKSGGWLSALEWIVLTVERECRLDHDGSVALASATAHPLPDDAADAVVTDPPYYDAVPYAHLSDFFYVWLRRALADTQKDLLGGILVPKDAEIVVDRPHELSTSNKDVAFYERELTNAFGEGRRVLRPQGIGTVVFASKSTASWEAILQAVVEAGWIITGSWPIDTEMESRVAAMGQARLASSVHLVCRPRERPDGSVRADDVGDWRDVLAELPRRIHEWMPRLAEEGVVGADAIFACLGPAVEIYSRYSRVEKASGEVITLREYLEQVWAAVSTEALSMIFKEADAAGLEPDARLTAMWFWTLGGGGKDEGGRMKDEGEEEAGEDAGDESSFILPPSSFILEYDAARKIAQGLGVHLEEIESVVEVKGDKARLRSVAERTKHLFGKDEAAPTATRRKKKSAQKTLFEDLEETEAVEGGWSEMKGPALGETVLDRVHQAMILFAAGRTDAIKRFLVEDGAGTDARFWKLAQSLSALYPKDTDEKRWVDGVLARKKGWGL